MFRCPYAGRSRVFQSRVFSVSVPSSTRTLSHATALRRRSRRRRSSRRGLLIGLCAADTAAVMCAQVG